MNCGETEGPGEETNTRRKRPWTEKGPWREDGGRGRLEAHENDEDEDEEMSGERGEEFEEEEEEEWSQNQVEARRLTQRASVAETNRRGLTGERTRMGDRAEQDWRRERAWYHPCLSQTVDGPA